MPLTASFTGVGIAPTVLNARAVTSTKVRIYFSERLAASSGVAIAGNYSITPDVGSAARTVTSVSLPDPTAPLYADLTLDGALTAGSSNYNVEVLGAFTDLIGNEISAPLDADFSGIASISPVPVDETISTFPLDAYRFLIMEIRKQDLAGTQLLKRFFDGINSVWQQNVDSIRALPDLWNIEKIGDDHLQYLKHIVGWTNDRRLTQITDAISDESLRRLIAASAELWSQRGLEATIINVLSLLTASRCRIWTWFDFRWILGDEIEVTEDETALQTDDATGLGEEHDGHDPWLVELPEGLFRESIVEEAAYSNRASGDDTGATVPLEFSTGIQQDDVFIITSGPLIGREAVIHEVAGGTIEFDEGTTNTIATATVGPSFSSVLWKIVRRSAGAFDEYRSNLRIVDDGNLDRALVKRVLRLMRPMGERFDITYLAFLDTFDVEGDSIQWAALASGVVPVEDGCLKLEGSGAEETYALATWMQTKAQYAVAARLRGTSTASGARFGVSFYRTSATNRYDVMIDLVAKTVLTRKIVSGVATTLATADLNALGFPVQDDLFYMLRASIVVEGATNRIIVTLDGYQLANVTDNAHSAGTVGLLHDANATLVCDEIEVLELPSDTDTLLINEEP